MANTVPLDPLGSLYRGFVIVIAVALAHSAILALTIFLMVGLGDTDTAVVNGIDWKLGETCVFSRDQKHVSLRQKIAVAISPPYSIVLEVSIDRRINTELCRSRAVGAQ